MDMDGGQVENVFLYLAALFYTEFTKFFDKLTVKPKQPRWKNISKDGASSESAAAELEYALLGELKNFNRCFFAGTFGAYAKVLSLHSITHSCFLAKARVNDIN
jgi:hypothetical protein